MLSTVHGAQMETLTRFVRGGEREEISKPNMIICNHTQRMGGVDTADHYIILWFYQKNLEVVAKDVLLAVGS